MRSLVPVLCFLSTVAFGQERPSDDEINARMQVFANQRNVLADREVVLSARIAVLEAELKKAKEAVCKLEKK